MNLEELKGITTRSRNKPKRGFGGSIGYRGQGVPKHGGDRRPSMFGLLLVACAVVAVLVTVDYGSNAGKIYRGVEGGTIPLGGKTPEEARGIVEDHLASDLREIRFVGGPQEVSIAPGKIGVRYDVEGTVDRAYAVGREGGVLARLGERLLAFFG